MEGRYWPPGLGVAARCGHPWLLGSLRMAVRTETGLERRLAALPSGEGIEDSQCCCFWRPDCLLFPGQTSAKWLLSPEQ